MSGEKLPGWKLMTEAGANPGVLNDASSVEPRHPAASSARAGELTSNVPLSPDSSGRPFLIGHAPSSDVVLGDESPASESLVEATICHTAEGWIVVDGTLHPDGRMSPSLSGIFVNGRRVQDYAVISESDILRIGRSSFLFVDPLQKKGEEAPVEGLEMGPRWFRLRESDGNLAATASFRGLIDKYNENQDRMGFRNLPDGSLMMMAIDGMGGHDSGERAAEIGRRAFYESVDSGSDLEGTIEAMNAEMFRDNRTRGTRGGAVIAGIHLHSKGWMEARTVGDAEVVVMSLPADLPIQEAAESLRIDYWSTRPTLTQAASYQIPTLPDGRILLGHERIVRLDPASNVVDTAAGMRPSTREMQTSDKVMTEAGRIYLAMPMSDGLTEQYLSHEEILEVVRDHLKSGGDPSPSGIRDALMRDALIRCALCRICNREGRTIDITSTRVRQAYREMSFEMDGTFADPEKDLPPWRYQSRTDDDGRTAHYFLVPFSGSAYLIKGENVEGRGWLPDPCVVDAATGNLSFNPAVVYHPSVIGRFKQDNISVGVAVFSRKS